MSNWINIEVNKRTRPARVVVTLSKAIRFNSSSIKDFKWQKVKYIKLIAKKEPDKNIIGFIPFETKEDSALTFSPSKSGGAFISGNSLFTALNIDPTKLKERKFKPHSEKYEEKDILVIEIPK